MLMHVQLLHLATLLADLRQAYNRGRLRSLVHALCVDIRLVCCRLARTRHKTFGLEHPLLKKPVRLGVVSRQEVPFILAWTLRCMILA